MAIPVFTYCKDEYKMKIVQWVIYVVSERKLAKLSFRAEREIFCLLKLLSLQISPFSRNDKRMRFRSGTTSYTKRQKKVVISKERSD